MPVVLLAALSVLAVSVIYEAPAAFADSAYAQSADEPVTVYMGVLTPGSAIEAAAIRQSITDVNDMLANIGAEWRLDVVYPDDGASIAEFIAKSQEGGVMAFVGPGDAVSLLHAKEAIADTGYNAVYVGCCVPATHHGILGSGDNVFVLAPDVQDQAAAVAAAMEAAGIEHAIPVYSGDLQSSSMRASIAAQFDGVMDSGVLVSPRTLDYSPVVSALSAKVESANGKAAVLVLEPDVTGGLMAAGSALADVAWFGTSSVSGPAEPGRRRGGLCRECGLCGSHVWDPTRAPSDGKLALHPGGVERVQRGPDCCLLPVESDGGFRAVLWPVEPHARSGAAGA